MLYSTCLFLLQKVPKFLVAGSPVHSTYRLVFFLFAGSMAGPSCVPCHCICYKEKLDDMVPGIVNGCSSFYFYLAVEG